MKTPPGPHAMTAQAGAVVPFGYISERSADFLLREGGTSIGTNIEREWDPHYCVPLYTTPPAAVPVEALEGLVDEWEAEAAALLGKSKRAANLVAAGDLNTRAAQLRKLIKERSNG